MITPFSFIHFIKNYNRSRRGLSEKNHIILFDMDKTSPYLPKELYQEHVSIHKKQQHFPIPEI